MVSSGPFTIAPGDSVTVAFALLAGDSLLDLQQSAQNAQTKYDSLGPLALSHLENVKGGFAVYPNPASDKLTIELGQGANGTLKIYNYSGQIVYDCMLSTFNDKIVYQVDVTNYRSGIYFIQLVNADGVELQKVVVE